MKINNIKQKLITAKNACLKTTNEIGFCIKGGVKSFGKGMLDGHDAFIRSGSCEKFCKETAIGAGAVGGVLILAGLCLKGIINKVKEVNSKQ